LQNHQVETFKYEEEVPTSRQKMEDHVDIIYDLKVCHGNVACVLTT